MKYLIVGLGNPTNKYAKTRHNIGFMALDFYQNGAQWAFNKSFNAQIFINQSCIFLKPHTFMNLSGESVRAVRDFYKIEMEKICVIHDDLDLKFGALRFKLGGGSGGHNGLKSLDENIGNNYFRARVGIGKPGSAQNADSKNMDSRAARDSNDVDSQAARDLDLKAAQIINYVLEPFCEAE